MMYTVQVGMDRFNFYLKNDRFVLETTKKINEMVVFKYNRFFN